MIVEVALILAPLLAVALLHLLAPPDSRTDTGPLAPATSRSDLPASFHDSILRRARFRVESAGMVISIAPDTSIFRVNDSVSATLISHADTLRSIHLSPAAARAADSFVANLGRSLSAIWWHFVIIASLIYLPIPIGLTILTVSWRVRRAQAAT